jgi:hypothetical protein
MSHDRGCYCGREKYEYFECPDTNCAKRITNYLGTGGLFNPELMDHDKVRDLLRDCRKELEGLKEKYDKLDEMYKIKSKSHAERLGDLSKVNTENYLLGEKIKKMALDSLTAEGQLNEEIERLKEKCDKQANILRQLTPEKIPGIKFIHAEIGTKDLNGMPEYLIMVPSYGSDVTYIYERKDVEK